MGKSTKKRNNNLIFDRILVIFCTVLVIASSAVMLYMIENQDEKVVTASTNNVVEEPTTEEYYGELVEIYAEYSSKECYIGTYPNEKSIGVYGVYENGGKKKLSGWSVELSDIVAGTNRFTVKYDKFTTEFTITGVDVNNVWEAKNYNIYAYDITDARRIVSDVQAGRLTYDEVFEDVLFCGDSRTKAIEGFFVLDKDKVLAKNGVGLSHLENYMQSLLASNPKTLILNYGVNSMSESSKARDELVAEYRELIETIQYYLPQTRIIVVSIFPTTDAFAMEQPRMFYIDAVNLELFRMCVELNIEFINGSYILEEEPQLFLADGLHFNEEFYKEYWLNELILKMGVGAVDFE